MSDNIVNFPTSANVEQQSEESIQQRTKKVLELLDKNRTKGLETINNKVDMLDQGEKVEDVKAEARLRNLERALESTLITLEALNSLVDYVKHDLIIGLQNMKKLGKDMFRGSATLQTLITLLSEKGMVSEPELKETWDKLVPKKIEEIKKEMD